MLTKANLNDVVEMTLEKPYDVSENDEAKQLGIHKRVTLVLNIKATLGAVMDSFMSHRVIPLQQKNRKFYNTVVDNSKIVLTFTGTSQRTPLTDDEKLEQSAALYKNMDAEQRAAYIAKLNALAA